MLTYGWCQKCLTTSILQVFFPLESAKQWSGVELSWVEQTDLGLKGLSFLQSSVCVFTSSVELQWQVNLGSFRCSGTLIPSPLAPWSSSAGESKIIVLKQDSVEVLWGKVEDDLHNFFPQMMIFMLRVVGCRLNKIECEEVYISLKHGAHKTPEYLSKWWWWMNLLIDFEVYLY